MIEASNGTQSFRVPVPAGAFARLHHAPAVALSPHTRAMRIAHRGRAGRQLHRRSAAAVASAVARRRALEGARGGARGPAGGQSGAQADPLLLLRVHCLLRCHGTCR